MRPILKDTAPPPSTSASSIDPPPPTESPCPDGYVSWYRNCYKLVMEPATWDAAQTACKQQGGNLVSIDMSYDQAFVTGVVLQGRADAWIGLRRKVLSGGNCNEMHNCEPELATN